MIYRVDGTVIPQTADECSNMVCVNNLCHDFRINGGYIFPPDAPYEHHDRMDCSYAKGMPIHSTVVGGVNYRRVPRDQCCARDVLIRQHLRDGGTLEEIDVVGVC